MSNQRGQAIVVIALMLTVVIGMAAVAIDGSRAYALRRDLQGAVDAAALAAGDKLQQTGSWLSAEQAAANLFSSNLRLSGGPPCTLWGSPGASPFTVTCNYSDGSVLTIVARGLGPQGSLFTVSGQRNLDLQFARILTNGTSPAIVSSSSGSVGNLLYTPTIGALGTGGCGGAGGNAISVNGSGTLNLSGDLVANGAVSVTSGAVRVAGDIYARCQSPVPGAVNTCYPSGASPLCTYPDTAGGTITGHPLADPGYPAPTNLGVGQGNPTGLVVQAGIYATPIFLIGSHCWFLSGGIYTFDGGTVTLGDFVSNELKPPDEPDIGNNQARAAAQFWNSNGGNCAGGFQVLETIGPRDLPLGNWGIEITSVRADTYNGVSYSRESAPSMCRSINIDGHFDDITVNVSNVPGATSYNIYASPAPNGCNGPFGFAANLPVSGTPGNGSTGTCPQYTGGTCSLLNEGMLLSSQIDAPFAPNAAAAPGTFGAYPPDREVAAVGGGLPNQNPARGAGAAGDRANENNCKSTVNTYVSCPGPITPGAVMFNFPAGSCMTATNGGDTYIFSGYQYNWMVVFEPKTNGCTNTVGAAGNSAYIGLFYCPSATLNVVSPAISRAPGIGGMIAANLNFSGTLPSITFSSSYAPVPPATRLTG